MEGQGSRGEGVLCSCSLVQQVCATKAKRRDGGDFSRTLADLDEVPDRAEDPHALESLDATLRKWQQARGPGRTRDGETPWRVPDRGRSDPLCITSGNA